MGTYLFFSFLMSRHEVLSYFSESFHLAVDLSFFLLFFQQWIDCQELSFLHPFFGQFSTFFIFLCFWRTVQKDVEKETSIFIRTFFHNHWLILLFYLFLFFLMS